MKKIGLNLLMALSLVCGMAYAQKIEAKSTIKRSTSQGWKVELVKDDFIATHSNHPNLKLPLKVKGAGNPVVKEWIRAPYGENLFVMKYESGVVGTSERVKVIHAIVVDVKNGNIYADEVLNYVDPLNYSKKLGPQPEWRWSNESLFIQQIDSLKPIQVKLVSK
jgi:hypothetical protein